MGSIHWMKSFDEKHSTTEMDAPATGTVIGHHLGYLERQKLTSRMM
jgi:hypothetical protein